jgi:hypothetical protein
MPSRAIQFYRYDASQRALRIVFTSGRRYVHAGVRAEIATAGRGGIERHILQRRNPRSMVEEPRAFKPRH